MERLCYLQRVVIILLILACVQNDDAKHTQANAGQNLQMVLIIDTNLNVFRIDRPIIQ